MAIRECALEGMEISPNFWCGKRVFLTGHTGFKGGWLSLWLHMLGAQVYGYSLEPPTHPNLFEVAQVKSGLASHTIGDICDRSTLETALRLAQPDIVFHMAAQPLVRYSYQEPLETLAVNVLGTANVLDCVRFVPSVRAVVNITTDKCYENREWCHPYRETDPLGGHDPYSASKACAEIVTQSYRASFFDQSVHEGAPAAIATVRAGNVIGGGDWAEARLIPDCIRACLAGEPLVLRFPGAIRPWQHVLEPLAGYLILAQHLWADPAKFTAAKYSNGWNFGPDAGGEATVETVAKQVIGLWGKGELQVDSSGRHPHEAGILRLDTTKARTQLGWRSRWTLTEGLERTVDWYQAWHQQADMQAYSCQQIATYQGERA